MQVFSINSKTTPLYIVVSSLAEMWGFEPQRRRNRPTGFRIRTLQPLGYISKLKACLLYQHRKKKSRFLLAPCQFNNPLHFIHDFTVVLSSVRNQAGRAILNTLFGVRKITAASVTQCIQWAIAKQTAKIFSIGTLVAGKILAGAVLEEIVVCHCLTPLI